MNEQLHKVQFFFNQDEQPNTLNVYHNIEIISNANELYAKNGEGDFSLYLGNSYLCLDFDTESKRIGNLGGIINLNDVNVEHIYFPKNILNGILYMRSDKEFIHYVCWRFEFTETYFYDSEQSILQIGTCNANMPCYKFLKNAYCQLDAQGNMECLLISNIKFFI